MARALVESSDSGGKLTRDLADQISELFLESGGTRRVHVCVDMPPEGCNAGDVLLLLEPEDDANQGARLTLEQPGCARGEPRHCAVLDFGVHVLGSEAARPSSRFFVSSPCFELASALDAFYDAYFWRWEDAWLDDELEDCLVLLVVSVEEDLSSFTGAFSAISTAMGGADELQELVEHARRELRGALAERDAGSIGRLHQQCFQFLDMGTMVSMMLPAQFIQAIERFDALNFLPVLDVLQVTEGGLAPRLRQLEECVVRDACSLGGLLGYSMAAGHEEHSARVLLGLLRAGLTYVTQGDRVVPVFPMRRAALQLSASAAARPRKLISRRKDVARMLRNAPPAQPLELRVSTDLATACAKLREHHPGSWVGAGLEAVWARMHAIGTLVTFELWCDGRMVAADLGHPVGRSFYVCTRWHDASLSKYQLGFVLALTSAKLLADAGFELWDLGGTDSSPGMRYKASVAETFDRPAFGRRFAEVMLLQAGAAGPDSSATDGSASSSGLKRPLPFDADGALRPGSVVLASITERDLF